MEESFAKYCLQSDQQAMIYWEQWLTDHPDQEAEILKAKELYFILNGQITDKAFQKDRIDFQTALESKMAGDLNRRRVRPAETVSPGRLLNIKSWLIASAAAAVVLIFLWVKIPHNVFNNNIKPANTGFFRESKAGERKSFQLPDGTEVTLNAGSTLTVSGDFNHAERNVILHGEGFFEVSHDKSRPFIIHTNYMDVKVLGTVFNVKAYDNDGLSETSLISGSVEVTLTKEGNKKVILHPNEKIILIKNQSVALEEMQKNNSKPLAVKSYKLTPLTHIMTDSSFKETSWLNNRLAFDQEQFSDIAQQLERWYDMKIVFQDAGIGQYRYTGTFEKKTIRQVLDALQASKHFSYQVLNDKEIIINE